jgi:hypothetical protein
LSVFVCAAFSIKSPLSAPVAVQSSLIHVCIDHLPIEIPLSSSVAPKLIAERVEVNLRGSPLHNASSVGA